MNRSDSRRTFLATGIGAAAWALGPASAETSNFASLTLKKASEFLRSKGASSVELPEPCLKRIDKYNPLVNAFITVNGESAPATARVMDAQAQRGKWRGPLGGASVLLGQGMEYEIANVVDPEFTIVAKMRKRFLGQAPYTAPRHADRLAVMKLLKGRSAALKLHAWSDATEHMPTRVVWKA